MKEYFSHDYNATSDEKIMLLLLKMGPEGYGIFWMLVEIMYKNGGSIKEDYELLAYMLNTEKDKVKYVVSTFALFYKRGKKIYSKSISRRINERENRSKMASESAKKRWNKGDANALQTHMQTQCDSNAIKEKKRKKEKEEEKENFSILGGSPPDPHFKPFGGVPTEEQVLNFCDEKKISRIVGKKFYLYNKSRGWNIGRTKIKDWQALLECDQHGLHGDQQEKERLWKEQPEEYIRKYILPAHGF